VRVDVVGRRLIRIDPGAVFHKHEAGSAEYDEQFLASQILGRDVNPFSRHTLRKQFRTACKVLGAARLESLTIHHGRHTFISHAVAGG
jgi:hypothetical protein